MKLFTYFYFMYICIQIERVKVGVLILSTCCTLAKIVSRPSETGWLLDEIKQ